MSCSISKLKSDMFFTCKNFTCSDFTWEKNFASGNGVCVGGGECVWGGVAPPLPPFPFGPEKFLCDKYFCVICKNVYL